MNKMVFSPLLPTFLLLSTFNMTVCGILYTLLYSLLVVLEFNSKGLLSCYFFPQELGKWTISESEMIQQTVNGLEPSYDN